MQSQQTSKPDDPGTFTLDTNSFAALNGVKGQSVRARICRFGSYFGVTPLRLRSGRLLWPNIQVAE